MSHELVPLGVAELMDRAIEAYRRSFWKQIAYAAIVWGILTVVLIIVGIIAIITLIATAITGGGLATGLTGFFVVALIVGLPLYLLWMGFSSAGHILLTRRALFGHMVSLSRVKIHVMAFRAISALVAQMFVFAPIVVLLFFVFRAAAFSLIEVILLGQFGILFIVLFAAVSLLVSLVFMLLANCFSLSMAAAMFEGCLFFKALLRSWELIRGDFWKIFATRLLWYLVAMGFTLAGQSILMLLWTLIGVVLGTGPAVLSVVALPVGFLSSIVSIVVSFAQMPMEGIMKACIYYNQRIKKDGLDIEIRLTGMWQTRNMT